MKALCPDSATSEALEGRASAGGFWGDRFHPCVGTVTLPTAAFSACLHPALCPVCLCVHLSPFPKDTSPPEWGPILLMSLILTVSVKPLLHVRSCSEPPSPVGDTARPRQGALQERRARSYPCTGVTDLPHPGIKTGFPALQVDFLPSEPPGNLPLSTKSHLLGNQCF